MLGKTSIDVEVHPQLTITEETAETCLWLLGKYLDANPDKTLKLTSKPREGGGFSIKLEIVPERKEKKAAEEKVPCKDCIYYGMALHGRSCTRKESIWYLSQRELYDSCKHAERKTCGHCQYRHNATCECITSDRNGHIVTMDAPICSEYLGI